MFITVNGYINTIPLYLKWLSKSFEKKFKEYIQTGLLYCKVLWIAQVLERWNIILSSTSISANLIFFSINNNIKHFL